MQTVTLILVDHSGSMKDNGKMDFAKKLLMEEVLAELNFSFMIGVKTFTIVEESRETLILPIHPLSLTNRTELTQKISGIINPSGGTPISAAIRDAVNDLKEYPAFEKRIVLVTDGEETIQDGINYENAIAEAGKEGFHCQIHIIGLGLDKVALEKANAISIATKGSVSNIPLTNGTPIQPEEVKESITPFINAIKTPVFPNGLEKIHGDETGSDLHPVTPTNKPTQDENGHHIQDANIPTATEPVPTPVESIVEADDHQPSEQIKPVTDLTGDEVWEAPPETPEVNPAPDQIDEAASPIQPEPQNINPVIWHEENVETRSPFSITITSRFFNDILVQMENLSIEMAAIKSTMAKKTAEEELKKLSAAEVAYIHNLLNKRYGERVRITDHSVFEIVLEDQTRPEYFVICKPVNIVVSPFCLTQYEWRLFLNYTKNTQICLVMEEGGQPKCVFIDNLLDWILKGKVVPYMVEEKTVQPGEVWLRIER